LKKLFSNLKNSKSNINDFKSPIFMFENKDYKSKKEKKKEFY